MNDETLDLTAMTVDIVSAFVSHNRVEPEALTGLIVAVHASLAQTGGQPVDVIEPVEQPSAAAIRKSVSEKGLISFLDGKTYQSLKRHLTTRGLTPAEYRTRYGLRDDYPMVAPAYAARRSALAKAIGLGQKGRQPKAAARTPRGRKGGA